MGPLHRLLSWDEAIFLRVNRWHRPWCTRAMIAFTRIGDWWTWTLIALLMVLSGAVGMRRVGFTLGFGALFAALLCQGVKRASRRARPDARIEGFQAVLLNPDRYSFPSGHTAAAFGAAMAMCFVLPSVGMALVVLASVIAFSRVYLGAHYPLDVAAGTVVGFLAGGLAYAAAMPLG